MFTFRCTTFLLLVTIVLSACREQETPFDPEAVENEVLATLSEYASVANSGDIDAALGFYIQDSRFRWVEDGVIRYTSYADLEQAIRSFAAFGSFRTEYEDPYVNALTADHAQLFTSFKTTVGDGGKGGAADADADDGETGGFSYSGAVTMNLVRTETGWKIMAGHTSTARERPDY